MKNILRDHFINIFKEQPEAYFSCGGRFEILGNHTDHNHGKCLAGTCSLNIYAAVKKRDDLTIRMFSDGYGLFIFNIENTNILENEKRTSKGIVRGIANFLKENNYKVGGFDIYINSKIPSGAGVSSSAAFELLISEIFNQLFNNKKIDRFLLCKASQYAERNYYGKMCGLLDQIGVGYGGFTCIDFNNIESPKIESTPIKMNGYHFLIINTGGSHAGLDDLYTSIPNDMFSVANFFNKKYLGELNKEDVIKNKETIISKLGNIPYNRAIHFFEENERVNKAKDYIKNNDLDSLITLMNESCFSSTNNLRNMYVDKIEGSPLEAINLIAQVAGNKAGVKINGGGFAGSIVCLCKDECLKNIIEVASNKYGKKNVFEIDVRQTGPSEIN